MFYSTGSVKGIQSKHSKKLRMQLSALDSAQNIEDMDIPGYRLHQLKGNLKNLWSITVNANWRITFEYSDGNVYIINYEDYH
jgi:proteic killer suppression protein